MSDLFELVREQVSVREALVMLGLGSSKPGPFRCPVPEHDDRNPSASAYSRRGVGRWWCYVCQKGGDVVDLVCVSEGMRALQAAEWLAGQAGLPFASSKGHRKRLRASRPKAPNPYEGSIYEELTGRWTPEQVAVAYECRLPKMHPALAGVYEYLEGELAFMRSRWREREREGVWLDEAWKVRKIRRWYRWALSVVAVELPSVRRVRRKKFGHRLVRY